MAGDAKLSVRDLHVYRGASHILQGVSLDLGSQPLAIVGRNGMGKTTLCQAIMGLLPARGGAISVGGRSIGGARPFRVARAGIGYVPQGRRMFPSLSVHEHLSLVATPSHLGRNRGGWTPERVYDTFPRLAQRRRNGGAQLSGGEQQMLAVARALLLNPLVLLMDEPTEGLAPVLVEQLVEVLRQLPASGIGLLLVEQNIAVATAVADRLLVMVNGTVALETASATIAGDEAMQRRYLGVATTAH